MIKHCLICESGAILIKDATVGIVLLVGIAGAWLQATHQVRKDAQGQTHSPLEYWYSLILQGLASVALNYRSALQTATGVTKYQFGDFNCQCLRCGSTFDEALE